MAFDWQTFLDRHGVEYTVRKKDLYIEGERWRWVSGYVGLYKVSNFGRIWSVAGFRQNRTQRRWHTGRILRFRGGVPNAPYFKVNLWKDSGVKEWYVHELVLLTFVGQRPSLKHQGNHCNGLKEDNRCSNLEWTLENTKHAAAVLGVMAKRLTIEKVLYIKGLLKKAPTGYGRYQPIAREFGVTIATIKSIDIGATWSHV